MNPKRNPAALILLAAAILTLLLFSACGSTPAGDAKPDSAAEVQQPAEPAGSSSSATAEDPSSGSDVSSALVSDASASSGSDVSALASDASASSGSDASGPVSDASASSGSSETGTPEPSSSAVSIAEEEAASAPLIPSGPSSGTAVPLRTFCNDPDLDRWFDSLEKNPPVRMNYVIFGIGPVYMEFEDPTLILLTAKALQTVTIDGVSEKNPDMVSDAGGDGYSFIMADGTVYSFSFVMGCFHWNGGEYHNVSSFGFLPQVNELLSGIGNPQFEYIYAPDDGFYTECLETYTTDWQDEDGLGGGLGIYLGETGKAPYIRICRCRADGASPKEFLKGDLDASIRSAIEAEGGTLLNSEETSRSTRRQKNLPGILYTIQTADGTGLSLLNLILPEEDDLLKEEIPVRFCAVYDPSVSGEEKAVLTALDAALDGFYLTYAAYDQKDVQPGSPLLDFCNDDRLRTWADRFYTTPPDELLYTSDSWHVISDPEKIRAVFEALKTVRIGGVSDAHVGGSGRQIFDFIFHDSGEGPTFAFFVDTFDWNGESYDVLDWGDLAGMDLIGMADK